MEKSWAIILQQLKLAIHPDYDLVYDNSPTNAGGVAIYVKHDIKFTVKRELKLEVDDCESLFIELDISDKLILGSQKTVLLGQKRMCLPPVGISRHMVGDSLCETGHDLA